MTRSQSHIRYAASSLILLWLGLEFSLAFKKGALGSSVVWIGLKISSFSSHIDLEISEESVAELRRLTVEAMGSNVVAKKWLQSYIGKCSALCGVASWRTSWEVCCGVSGWTLTLHGHLQSCSRWTRRCQELVVS